MKIKIGENEFQLDFCISGCDDDGYWVVDANGKPILPADIKAALNELAALRSENEAFREDHHKHDEWMAWAQSYFNNHTDLCMWGSRLDVGIRETLIARDQELAQLRQERDALVKERDELKNGILRVQVQFFRENVVAVINAEKLPELIKQLIATHSVNITPTKQKTEPLPVKVGKAMRECIRVESPTTKDGDA